MPQLKTNKMNNSVLNQSRREFESYLGMYKVSSDKKLLEIKHRFSGDAWKLNKASIQSADLCPFAIKEAYLKALDLRGMERPDCGRFVPESEAINEADFWNTSANPVTGTKIHDTYDWTEDEDNTVDYDYQF